MHVLIVGGERKLATSLKRSLEEENHSVGVVFDGHDALEMAQALEYDAIVLELMLPGIDGLEVIRRLRKTGNKTPILVLSSRNSVSDIVNGLDIGAHDYMSKPFSFDEFLARLRSVSRCASFRHPAPLQVGDMILNPNSHEVTRDGNEILLSPTEYRLLEFLTRRAGRIVPTETIIHSIWSYTESFDKNTLHTFIKVLRKKIDQGREVKLVQTARRFGYGILGPHSH